MKDQTRIHHMAVCQPAAKNRVKGAAHIGVSPGHFDKLVRVGLMPQPRLADGVSLWLCIELDEALFALPTRDQDQEVSSCDAAFGVQ